MTNSLNDFAPFPTYDSAKGTTAPEPTADNLARNMTVFAQAQITAVDHLMGDHSEEGKRRYRDRIGILVETFAAVYLLRALADKDPDLADETAAGLWECLEDGASINELVWEWLTEYGIDPAAVSKVATRMWDGRQGKAA